MIVKIYTDGSLKNNVGAWSFVVCESNRIIKKSGIKKNVSINNLELKAVNEALSFSITSNYEKIEILTDSSYVFNIVKQKSYKEWEENKWLKKNGKLVKNKEEWEEFKRLLKISKHCNMKVNFTKVKAHKNSNMNSVADKIAKDRLNSYLEV